MINWLGGGNSNIQYFAKESQHQHGAFDKTGGFTNILLFSSRKLGK